MALWSSSKLLAGQWQGNKRPGTSRKDTEVDGERRGHKEREPPVSRSLYYHPHSDQTKYQGSLTNGKLETLTERSDSQGACVAVVLNNDDG